MKPLLLVKPPRDQNTRVGADRIYVLLLTLKLQPKTRQELFQLAVGLGTSEHRPWRGPHVADQC